jgi:hypothetical protein
METDPLNGSDRPIGMLVLEGKSLLPHSHKLIPPRIAKGSSTPLQSKPDRRMTEWIKEVGPGVPLDWNNKYR